MLANFIRFLVASGSFYLVGLCLRYAWLAKSSVVRHRIIGLGLLAGALVMGSIQHWGESYSWSWPLVLPGLVFAIVGMRAYRPDDTREGPHSL